MYLIKGGEFMKKVSKIIFSSVISLALVFNFASTNAEPLAKPPGEGNSMGAAGGEMGSSNVTHKGATTIESDTNESGKSYSSAEGSENTILVSGGTSTLSDITVTKSGDSDGDNSDFYGTNAAILAKGGTLNINGGNITTNGSHANGVFAYSSGVINISDANIKTSSNNSGAVMVTGGGTLTANNLTATTDGNSSAPIRSDRGGGTLTVNKGTYTANGVGSPAIYSTANITVNSADLISTKSEGVVVEGKNSVTLNNVNLTDTNTSLNGNSETYKNIFLYQSMSGDAEAGNSSFTANNSNITTNKGDTIFVTNTKSTISLENNKIVNNDKDAGFLRIQSGKWGNSGENGGEVTLNTKNQNMEGNVYVDNISALEMNLSGGSSYLGAINGDNTAKTLSLSLDSSSKLTLTGDTYLTSLKNEVSDNSNINLNGYKLYVNGESINAKSYKDDTSNNAVKSETDNKDNKLLIILISTGILLAVIIFIIFISKKKKK